MPRLHPNTILGLIAITLAVFAFFVWIPLDSASGIVEVKRRKLIVGDGLAPSVAAAFLFVPGVLLVFGPKPKTDTGLSWRECKFLVSLVAIIAIGLLIMRFAGPLFAAAFTVEYRPLRDTVPWKYIGFALGGIWMITAIIMFMEGRASWRALWIATCAVIVMIALFDWPFDDLLLPPNGDV